MILPQIHSGVSGEGWWTCNPKSAKTKTPLVRQAKRLIWKLKQMKNDTRRWIQPMTTFSDCCFIACGFVASREPSQRISEVEMFKHLPSISDAQYFLSHETVCWMVMAKRWKASNVPTSSTCYRLLLNILNLHGVPKCERSKAHSKSYRRMFPVSSARSKWKNLSWNRVFQHEQNSEFPILLIQKSLGGTWWNRCPNRVRRSHHVSSNYPGHPVLPTYSWSPGNAWPVQPLP